MPESIQQKINKFITVIIRRLYIHWLRVATSTIAITSRSRSKRLGRAVDSIDFSGFEFEKRALSARKPSPQIQQIDQIRKKLEFEIWFLRTLLSGDIEDLKFILKGGIVSFKILLLIAERILPRAQRECALGDLEEKYQRNCFRFSIFKAKKILICDILKSAAAAVRECCRRLFS